MSGRLSVVATPIGSLDDISVRALRVLREADLILAEDTRRTRVLTNHHGIDAKLRAYHAHSSEGVLEAILRDLEGGAHFALVSDAGTPLVSDPGYELVDAARARGIAVDHLPGPSAVLTALCVAGLRCDDFRFVGFLPRSGARRRALIDSIATSATTTVFFEAPPRIADTLMDLRAKLDAGTRVAVCRELTKLHEQVIRGTVSEVLENLPDPVLGEITVVVEGKPGAEEDLALDEATIDARIDSMLGRGIAPKAIAKELAEAAGESTRELYRRVVERSSARR